MGETEEPGVGMRGDEETTQAPEKAETQAPEEEKAQEEKTGLTPDKISLAACKTPAKKKDDDKTSSDSKEEEEKKSAAPTMTMRFVDETVETSKEDTSRDENKDTK